MWNTLSRRVRKELSWIASSIQILNIIQIYISYFIFNKSSFTCLRLIIHGTLMALISIIYIHFYSWNIKPWEEDRYPSSLSMIPSSLYALSYWMVKYVLIILWSYVRCNHICSHPEVLSLLNTNEENLDVSTMHPIVCIQQNFCTLKYLIITNKYPIEKSFAQ